jgi:hypothetical protein
VTRKPKDKQVVDVKDISTAALKAEVARREQEEREAKDARNMERRIRQAAALTPEVIAALAPEHGRTSCSDTNLVNGWGSHSSGHPRCLRCALLEGDIREGFHYELGIVAD